MPPIITPWDTDYPGSQDDPVTSNQPDLQNATTPDSDDGDLTQVSQIHTMRDKLDAVAKKVGDDNSLPASSILDRLDTIEPSEANAVHTTLSGEITTVAEKVSPVSSDWILIEDSADTEAKKKVQIGNLPSSGGASPLTTKGDLYAYSTGDARLPVGVDGYVLTSDSTETIGLKWVASSTGATVPGQFETLASGVTSNININVTSTPVLISPETGSHSFIANAAGDYRVDMTFLGYVQYSGGGVDWHFKVVFDEGEASEVTVGDDQAWGHRSASNQTADYIQFAYNGIATLEAKTYTVKGYGTRQGSSGNILIPTTGGIPQISILSSHTSDSTAIHTTVSGEIATVEEKLLPGIEDWLIIEDSTDTNVKKKIQVGNLPGGSGTDENAIHTTISGEIDGVAEKLFISSSDIILIEDSSSTYTKKKVQASNLGLLAPTRQWTYLTTTTPSGVMDPEVVYQFDGTTSSLDDRTTNSHDLTVNTGSAVYTAMDGLVGLLLNGEDLSAPLSAALQITGDITIEALISWKNNTSSTYAFVTHCHGGAETEATNLLYGMCNQSNNAVWFHEYSSGSNQIYSFSTRPPDDHISYVTMVRDGLSGKLFVDGHLISSVTFSNLATGGTSSVLHVGQDLSNTTVFGIRITAAAMTDSDVAQAFEQVFTEATGVDILHTTVSGEIYSVEEKSVAAVDDLIIIEDSEDNFSKKKVKILNLGISGATDLYIDEFSASGGDESFVLSSEPALNANTISNRSIIGVFVNGVGTTYSGSPTMRYQYGFTPPKTIDMKSLTANDNITAVYSTVGTYTGINTTVSGEIVAAEEKTTLNSDDVLLIEDSEDTYEKKKVTFETVSSGVLAAAPMLWAKPLLPHAHDVEFDSGTSLPSGWSESFTPSASEIDPYAGFSSGTPRRSLNSWRNSCYSIQCPADNTGYTMSKAFTVPTNFFIWMRGSFAYRYNQSLNNEASLGLVIGETSGGALDTDNAISMFIWEADTSIIAGLQAQYSVGGSFTIVNEVAQGTTGNGQMYEYVGIQKLNTTYHFWAFSATGQAMWLGSASPAITPDRVGAHFVNVSTSSPGNMICTVDFIRFKESSTFLPGYGN